MLLHAVVLLEHPLDLQPSARPRQLAPVARHNSYACPSTSNVDDL
jgi:hypothetical protein